MDKVNSIDIPRLRPDISIIPCYINFIEKFPFPRGNSDFKRHEHNSLDLPWLLGIGSMGGGSVVSRV